MGSIPGLGRSPGEGTSNHSSVPHIGVLLATVHGVAKDQTERLNNKHSNVIVRSFNSFIREESLFIIFAFFFLIIKDINKSQYRTKNIF